MEPEYFTALNEAAAHKYVGKTMEFADKSNLWCDSWEKRKLCSTTGQAGPYSFKDQNGIVWEFVRTCEETFKPEKKVFEKWVTIYPSGCTSYYSNKEDANRSRDLDRRIACLHIRQEYEVKE